METLNQLSEITINYKSRIKASDQLKISGSMDVVNYFRSIWSERMEYVEEAYLLILNRANKILGFTKISVGGTIGTIVDVKLIFHAALKANACSIILAHNHPSGNINPSDEDKELTKKVAGAGKLLDIQLLDHIIITKESYFSFSDQVML